MNKIAIGKRVSFEYGFAVRVDKELLGNYPVFGSNGITGYINSYKVEEPGVIIGRKGSVGKIAFSSKPFTPTDTAYYLSIKDKSKDDMQFWFYFLQLLRLEKLNSHSAVPGLSRELAYLLEVKIPEKNDQIKIANILSKFDRKIELNNRINAELEAMAKTLYDYWFVQFDFPNEEGKPYKSSGGKMVYNNILKREIPEGWETNTIAQVFSTSLGGTPSTHNKDYWHNADIHWISSAETTFFPIISSEQKITLKGLEHSAACLLPKGTVVISIVRYIRPSILGVDAATNQSVVGIKETDIFKSSFIYPYLCGEVPKFMALRTGAQQPHINKKVIDDNIIIIPINSVLELYYKIANPIFDKIMTVAFENKHLIELRDFLLPMLMNGQVTVK
ncbi:restriction endonuclease subunit S [Gilliamella apis]|uniref:restriction endonuclease subunit S n=1 Tax=Gilliamella apis TaxID=1970738 RepID=UPI000D783A81|nr:restriction endonuclease subunit S [Gilliamella apis]PXY93001.1 restriction endonuclease subunit S [Gilliamella apis]WLS95417.1 restriction endonuclease subunit S [Gilliamella apis]